MFSAGECHTPGRLYTDSVHFAPAKLGNFSPERRIDILHFYHLATVAGYHRLLVIAFDPSLMGEGINIQQTLVVIFKASALWADAFYKSKCPSVCMFVCLFTFEVPFNGLFAPTSRSRMSNIFRDSESLGKSNGKKWSQI